MSWLRMRPLLGLLLLLAAAVGAAALRPPVRAQTEVVTIEIVYFSFRPDDITIPVGTTVEWVNRDLAVHTSTSDTGVWDSGPLQGRGIGRFRFTFNQPGTYTYHCEVHPDMTARIVVLGPPATPTPQPTPTATPQPSPTPTPPVPAPGPPMTRIYLPVVFQQARP